MGQPEVTAAAWPEAGSQELHIFSSVWVIWEMWSGWRKRWCLGGGKNCLGRRWEVGKGEKRILRSAETFGAQKARFAQDDRVGVFWRRRETQRHRRFVYLICWSGERA